MQIAFLLYEGLTALDIVGPYEVLNQIPAVPQPDSRCRCPGRQRRSWSKRALAEFAKELG